MMSSVKATVDPEAVMNPAPLLESEKRLSAVSPIGGQFSHRTRSANIERFAKERFDLAVIGGVITGAGIARDAAMRGMKVARWVQNLQVP